PRPGSSEHLIIQEMLEHSDSEHWDKCHEFVMRRVYARAKNIPKSGQEEIIQEVMYKVAKSLPNFGFKSAFRTWLSQVIEHCIIDKYRKQQHEEQYYSPLTDTSNENDREGGDPDKATMVKSTEKIVEEIDEIRHGWAALLEYVND